MRHYLEVSFHPDAAPSELILQAAVYTLNAASLLVSGLLRHCEAERLFFFTLCLHTVVARLMDFQRDIVVVIRSAAAGIDVNLHPNTPFAIGGGGEAGAVVAVAGPVARHRATVGLRAAGPKS